MAPERSANHVTYGYVASSAGDKELARAEYELAVTLDPNDSAAWNNLGCLDLEAGRPLRARLRFREALRLDPQGGRARRNLEMAAPRRPPPRARDWDGFVEQLLRELVAASAPRATVAALVFEAPSAAGALVRGGRTGAALSGGALAVALRAMGRAAIGPLAVGAAAAGAAWLIGRTRLRPRRVHRAAPRLARPRARPRRPRRAARPPRRENRLSIGRKHMSEREARAINNGPKCAAHRAAPLRAKP